MPSVLLLIERSLTGDWEFMLGATKTQPCTPSVHPAGRADRVHPPTESLSARGHAVAAPSVAGVDARQLAAPELTQWLLARRVQPAGLCRTAFSPARRRRPLGFNS